MKSKNFDCGLDDILMIRESDTVKQCRKVNRNVQGVPQ